MALALLLLSASAVRADVQNITIAVNGVVCPVCAHSLNMGLRRVAGIKSVKVLMENRVNLSLTLQPHTWIDPRSLFGQISLVGYRARPNEVRMRLRGTVTVRDGQLLLTVGDVAPGPVALYLDADEHAGRQYGAIKAAMETLKKPADADRVVEVEGWWRAAGAKGEPATLLLTRPPIVP